MAKLTEKQKLFVSEYLIDLNATQAAIRAGYSPKTSEQIGYQMLKKTSVSDAIAQAMAERSKRTGITSDRVLNELAMIGFANAADIINFGAATVKGDASREDTACIQSVKVKTIPTDAGDITEREVKLYDKKSALELIGKHLGMFKDKLEVSGIDKEKSKLDNILSQMRGDG
ncbi:MAG: terminase small subunit [Lachnospiraceae bacterium]